MARPDPWSRINRLLDEIGILQTRIVAGVRRTGMTPREIERLERQVARRKARIEVLKREYLSQLVGRERVEGAVAPGESPMTVDEAMTIAETLKTQRPLIYNTEEWQAFRRVCAALAELFDARFSGAATRFSAERFLVACGLSASDAHRLAPPG